MRKETGMLNLYRQVNPNGSVKSNVFSHVQRIGTETHREYNVPKSPRQPYGLKRYAELMGNHKNLGIKSLKGNILEIGRVYGFKVIVSNVENISADKYSIFYHKSAVGWAFQEAVKVEKERHILGLANRWVSSFMGGAKVLDSGKRQVRFEETA